MGKTYHLCLDVRGALNNWTKKNYNGYMVRADGSVMSYADARKALVDSWNLGRKVIPIGECDNFDYEHGCQGHEVEGAAHCNKDRAEICKIISEMLDNPDEIGIYQTTKAYDQLTALVHSARVEAIGWAYTYACLKLESGADLRETHVHDLLEQAENDLCD
jgi:hypothetical protein